MVDTLTDDVYQVIFALPEHTVTSTDKLYAHIRSTGRKASDKNIDRAVTDLVVAERLVEVFGKRGAKGYRAVLISAEGGSE